MVKGSFMRVKDGTYEGKTAYVDGTVADIFNWHSIEDIESDCRPVVKDFYERCDADGVPVELQDEVGNLVYTHIYEGEMSFGHVFHISELEPVYPIERNLDGIYFRVKRDGKWYSICLSDMTEEEMREIFDKMNYEMLKSTAVLLAQTVRKLGDTFNISCVDPEDDE